MRSLPTTGKFHRLDDATFEEFVLKQQKTCVVCCYSNQTGESPILEAIIERTIGAYPSILFFRINMDENPNSASRYSMDRRQHTLLFFKNGEVVDWHYGIIPKRVFRAKLDYLSQR